MRDVLKYSIADLRRALLKLDVAMWKAYEDDVVLRLKALQRDRAGLRNGDMHIDPFGKLVDTYLSYQGILIKSFDLLEELSEFEGTQQFRDDLDTSIRQLIFPKIEDSITPLRNHIADDLLWNVS